MTREDTRLYHIPTESIFWIRGHVSALNCFFAKVHSERIRDVLRTDDQNRRLVTSLRALLQVSALGCHIVTTVLGVLIRGQTGPQAFILVNYPCRRGDWDHFITQRVITTKE